MAKSIKKHMPDAKVNLCMVEENIPQQARDFPFYDHIVLAKDLGFPNFYQHVFKHNAVEACTSIKARLFLYLLNLYPKHNKFIFLDGDTKIYGPFVELNEILNTHSIVVTPHILQPEASIDRVKSTELTLSKFGMYNLGFIAIRRSENANRFLNWWASRLEMFCYIDAEKQIFTDQRWIDYAPTFFDVHILKHHGYNKAPWNLYHRQVLLSNDNKYIVNDQYLRFFHFSGVLRVKGEYNHWIKTHSGVNDVMIHMVEEYINEIMEYTQNLKKEEPWSYDYFTSGEKIDMRSRMNYRNHLENYSQYINPFLESNKTFQVENPIQIITNPRLIFGMVITKTSMHIGMILAKSIKEHHPDSRVIACVVEDIIPRVILNDKNFDIFVSYQDIGMNTGNVTQQQLTKIIKPRFLSYMQSILPNEERFILINADIKLYSPLEELKEILNSYEIVLVPHILHPNDIKSEMFFKKIGLYNQGFVAIKRSLRSRLFLDWWISRIESDAVNNNIHPYGTNWLDYTPAYFHAYIIRHAGYDVAHWNINHRPITEELNRIYSIHGQKLRFIQFSGILNIKQMNYIRRINTKHTGNQVVLKRLVDEYYHELAECRNRGWE